MIRRKKKRVLIIPVNKTIVNSIFFLSLNISIENLSSNNFYAVVNFGIFKLVMLVGGVERG